MLEEEGLDELGVPNTLPARRQSFRLLKAGAVERGREFAQQIKLLEIEEDSERPQLLTLMLRKGNGAFHYAVCTDTLKDRTSLKIPGRRFRFGRPAASAEVDDGGLAMEKLFRCLQAAGADVNLQNHLGQTPLHMICTNMSGFPGFVTTSRPFDDKLFAALVKAGADLGVREHSGQTPLFFHVQHRAPEELEIICKSMSQAGARLDITDNNDWNLLHAAVSNPHGDQDLLRLLVGYGLDPNATDAEGNTLWHATIPRMTRQLLKRSSPELCLYDSLLGLGVDYRRPNNSGRTPLHEVSSLWALVYDRGGPRPGEATAFDYILGLYDKHDVAPRDKDGVAPLHLACTFSEYQA